MKIGPSKRQQKRDMEQRMAMKRTVSGLNKYINNLEDQKQKYIEAAKKAKLNGMDNQLSLAISGLKTAVSYQKRAEEMLLNFELTMQMKDLTGQTSSFLDSMSMLSREMCKITKNTDFLRVQQEFENAMTGVEQTSEQLEMFLDGSEDSYKNIARTSSQISDDEILKLVDIEASGDQMNLDNDIAAKLDAVSKLINNNTNK